MVTGVGAGIGSEAIGGGEDGLETTEEVRSTSPGAAGTRTAISFGTSLMTIRSTRDSSNLVASAMPATSNCDIAMSANAQQQIENTGTRVADGGFKDSDPMDERCGSGFPLSIRRV